MELSLLRVICFHKIKLLRLKFVRRSSIDQWKNRIFFIQKRKNWRIDDVRCEWTLTKYEFEWRRVVSRFKCPLGARIFMFMNHAMMWLCILYVEKHAPLNFMWHDSSSKCSVAPTCLCENGQPFHVHENK